MITIRPFSPADAEAVAEMVLPIQQEECGVVRPLDQQPDLQDIATCYQRGKGHFWVALEGDQVVGTLGLLDIGNDQAALRWLFVARSHRGTRLGIATALFETMLTWAHAQSIHTVFMGIASQSEGAHRFCERHGFERVPRFTLPAAFPMTGDARFHRRSVRRSSTAVRAA